MTTAPAAAPTPAPAALPPSLSVPPSAPVPAPAPAPAPVSVSVPAPAPASASAPVSVPLPTGPAAPWQITGGQPTAEETAALAAVLTALLAHHAASRQTPARPAHTDTVWDRVHHNPHVRTGSWRSR